MGYVIRQSGSKWEVGVTNMYGQIRLQDAFIADSKEDAQEWIDRVEEVGREIHRRTVLKRIFAQQPLMAAEGLRELLAQYGWKLDEPSWETMEHNPAYGDCISWPHCFYDRITAVRPKGFLLIERHGRSGVLTVTYFRSRKEYERNKADEPRMGDMKPVVETYKHAKNFRLLGAIESVLEKLQPIHQAAKYRRWQSIPGFEFKLWAPDPYGDDNYGPDYHAAPESW